MGLSDAIDITKRLKEVYDDGKHLDLLEQINQLRQHLLDAREELVHVREQKQDTQDELAALKKRGQAKVVHRERVIFLTDESGEERGPYCPDCYENKGELRSLKMVEFKRVCPSCSADFGPSKAQEKEEDMFYDGIRRANEQQSQRSIWDQLAD